MGTDKGIGIRTGIDIDTGTDIDTGIGIHTRTDCRIQYYIQDRNYKYPVCQYIMYY